MAAAGARGCLGHEDALAVEHVDALGEAQALVALQLAAQQHAALCVDEEGLRGLRGYECELAGSHVPIEALGGFGGADAGGSGSASGGGSDNSGGSIPGQGGGIYE